MSERAARRGLAALLVLYVLAIGGLALYQHYAFLDLTYDLALYAQALHQFARGSTWISINHAYFLGIHAHWTHFLLTPLAWLGAAVPGLLLLQTGAVAAGAAGLFRFARLRGVAPGPALAATAAFLATPLVLFPNLFAYHPEVLGAAFLPWAAVFLEEERFWPFVAACVLLAACKETCGLLVAGIGLVTYLRGRPARWSLTAGAIGLAAFVGGLVVMRAWSVSAVTSESFFGPLGASIGEVVATVFTRPVFTLRYLATPARGALLLALLGGFAFLPLLRPAWALAAAPLLGVHLLAALPTAHTVRYHYHALVVTALGLAALEALAARPRGQQAGWAGALVALALAGHALASPLLEHPTWRAPQAAAAHRAEWSRLVAAIPPGRGVSAPIACAAHLADREVLYLTPFVVRGVMTPPGGPLDEAVDYLIAEEARVARRGSLREWARDRGLVPCLEGPRAWVYRRPSAPPLVGLSGGETGGPPR